MASIKWSQTSHPRIYLAGPMSGYPDHNYPAFNAAAARLREVGWIVRNPAETDAGGVERPQSWWYREGLRMLIDSDMVVVLPGWLNSKGAWIEVKVARSLGMPVVEWAMIVLP